MEQLIDAVNAAEMEGKRVAGIMVSSPELWTEIHASIQNYQLISSGPDGIHGFLGVPIRFLVNRGGPEFTLEFA